MKPLRRFGVSLEGDLLQRFDRLIGQAGYLTRSEAFRDLIRARLQDERIHDPAAKGFGVLALVYDHHIRELEKRMTNVQHDHHHHIISTTHIHIDHHTCLEVVVLKGTVGTIRKIAEQLGSFRGVKHSELMLTSPTEVP